jgi:glycosyltransferase involved in cell wall biosynthesis
MFLGFCENDLIHEILNSTDIFLLPSQREGLPTVILEAMSHGIPVIASDVGGIPELVQHGKTGYLAPPGDCDEFKDKLVHLIKNPQKRKLMGECGRRLVDSQFSLDLMVGSIEQKYLELYKSNLKNNLKIYP